MFLHFFILGWLGGVWWFGIEVDAPPPKGDPWWGSLVLGVAGGIAAVVIAQVAHLGLTTFADVAVTVGAGAVGGTIMRSVLKMMRK